MVQKKALHKEIDDNWINIAGTFYTYIVSPITMNTNLN